ncbi:FAD/NAD(P)-binding domain-containing protein [Zopfia rhizophila CBS 207.26]|uniref:FAD/NAD(P)-binding domain-containing protein n=1 Tax=Zopfia rhizophila CBS 207.26 TaxID=1314779 RepID=A0A6A6EIR8_9PEZI|nr:FAD/NAD(P)-binding domain-containing protein [Zopfia rhizophila CBS 207.26]
MSTMLNLPENTPRIKSAVNGASTGGSNRTRSPFKLHDAPIENFRRIKIIVIGAGYSGIYCGIRIPEKIRNVDLVIYEKNAGVGGTWWENKYPGCACDVPSHSYQFSFEPNLNWSSLYAPSYEIQAYLERVAKKYSADRFIKLSHEITECQWDEYSAKWHVTVKNLNTGEVIKDTSDVLISARGNLNNPSWPDIEGFEIFKGEVMHSAKWNESYDFSNKRIAVIGSGSSAIQIVPSLQRLPGTHLSTFVRSKTWISPSFGQQLWDKYGFEGHAIPAELRDEFNSDPEHYHEFRLAVEEDGNAIHGVTIRGTPIQQGAKQMFKEHMQKRLETAPHIFEALLPSFSPGCRRLTPGPGYLEALTQPNVAFVTSPISRISESAVHTKDGKTHDVDVLVCATGFHTSAPPPFEVIGQNGVTIKRKWTQRATTYLSHSISSFPNMFMMLGPNAAIGSGSLTMMIESVGDYIIKSIRKIQKDNIASMVVKEEREDDFTEYVDAYFEKTVFMEECRSWYRNGKTGAVVGLWPGSTLHCVECMRSPRWEDFEYTYIGEDEDEDAAIEDDRVSGAVKRERVNRMAWLGNGWSVNQLEQKDLAWYLYPEFQDKPLAPFPEEKEGLKIRSFSY